MIELFIPEVLLELLQGMLCQLGSGSWKRDQAPPPGCAQAWLPCGPSPASIPMLKLLLEEGRRGKEEC